MSQPKLRPAMTRGLKNVSYRLPSDIVSYVEDHAERHITTRSEILRQLLIDGLRHRGVVAPIAEAA